MKGRSLAEVEGGAGLVPQLAAVGEDLGTGDAVEDNDAVVSQNGQHLGHDFPETTAVTSDKDGIRTG